jgi:predicted metal-dependent hydrolase
MTARSVVIGRDGRAKAYRPLPADTRAAAVTAGLQAYAVGDFFEAHELWEPAWMGTDVPGDRALLQGLIKLAAAYVHGIRGNPAGIVRNLEGARARLIEANEDRTEAPLPVAWLDLPELVAEIDRRLADLATHPEGPTLGPPDLPRSHP